MSPTESSIPTPDVLLDEVRAQNVSWSTYPELEAALIDVMRRHRKALSSHVTARDVLIYARDKGLVVREGDRLVVHARRY